MLVTIAGTLIPGIENKRPDRKGYFADVFQEKLLSDFHKTQADPHEEVCLSV